MLDNADDRPSNDDDDDGDNTNRGPRRHRRRFHGDEDNDDEEDGKQEGKRSRRHKAWRQASQKSRCDGLSSKETSSEPVKVPTLMASHEGDEEVTSVSAADETLPRHGQREGQPSTRGGLGGPVKQPSVMSSEGGRTAAGETGDPFDDVLELIDFDEDDNMSMTRGILPPPLLRYGRMQQPQPWRPQTISSEQPAPPPPLPPHVEFNQQQQQQQLSISSAGSSHKKQDKRISDETKKMSSSGSDLAVKKDISRESLATDGGSSRSSSSKVGGNNDVQHERDVMVSSTHSSVPAAAKPGNLGSEYSNSDLPYIDYQSPNMLLSVSDHQESRYGFEDDDDQSTQV